MQVCRVGFGTRGEDQPGIQAFLRQKEIQGLLLLLCLASNQGLPQTEPSGKAKDRGVWNAVCKVQNRARVVGMVGHPLP
jgi:hypothetical protein